MKRLLSVFLLAIASVAVFGQGGRPAGIPAYHSAPPMKTADLPPILAREQLWGPSFQNPSQRHAYELASQVGPVLYQEPCYCGCDRSAGHTSLRSCFESTHAAHCSTCMQEAYYVYEQTKAGKTPRQIRNEIVKGEWQKVNLNTTAQVE